MSFDPAEDLATYIGTNVAAVTLGINGFFGPVRPPEDGYQTKAVFCIEGGGTAAEPYNGGSNSLTRSVVQVRTRGDKDAYLTGKDFTDSIFAVTHHASVTGYVNTRNLVGKPTYIGQDKGGRHEWSWDVEMMFEGAP